ncbi:MAG: hypothetical protein CMP10_14520 [Zetaproteobacteria bacterium]|nr:hypothetical protein [Pseudobdellovibrionaceae bacterium]
MFYSSKFIGDKFQKWVMETEQISSMVKRMHSDFTVEALGPIKEQERISILPRFLLTEDELWVNNHPIPLYKKTLTYKLFKLFLDHPGKSFGREDIVQAIYQEQSKVGGSRQFQRSLHQNVVKLMSRSRNIATEACKGTGQRCIDWFYYDSEKDKWSLYRLSHDYLVYKEKEINQIFTNQGLVAR